MPKFSIILPTHNGEDRIGAAITSVQMQTFTDYELIVVFDSCTDDTKKYVTNMYEDNLNDPRLKFVDVDVQRDGLARNAGLDASTGEWILFLDDDDHFIHEYCLQQIADMLNDDMDLLSFSFIAKNTEYFSQSPERYFTGIWAHAWRRTFIGEDRFSDLDYGSDSEFTHRIVSKGARIKFWDMPIYYYNYMREGSLTWKKANT